MSPNDSIDSNMVAYGSGSSSISRIDDWSIPSRIALASIGSQGTMGGLVIAGFVSSTIFIFLLECSVRIMNATVVNALFLDVENCWMAGYCGDWSCLWLFVHV